MTLAESYAVLGLRPGVDKDSIRSAYRSLAKKYHPDVNTSRDAGEKFIRIKLAYDILNNAEDYELQQAQRPITKAAYYEKLYKEKLKSRQAAHTPAGNAYTGYKPSSSKHKSKSHSSLYYLSRYFAFVLIALTVDVFIERNFIMFIMLSFICLPTAFYILKWTKSID